MNSELADARSFVLIEGVDDFVELRLVANHLGDILESDDAALVRDRALAVLGELLESDLVVAGTLDERTGELRPWPGAPREVLDRIETEWRALSRPVGLYEIACFRDTPKGQKVARDLKLKFGLP